MKQHKPVPKEQARGDHSFTRGPSFRLANTEISSSLHDPPPQGQVQGQDGVWSQTNFFMGCLPLSLNKGHVETMVSNH